LDQWLFRTTFVVGKRFQTRIPTARFGPAAIPDHSILQTLCFWVLLATMAIQEATDQNGTPLGKKARWDGIERPCSPLYVARLRGSLQIEHTLARRGAERLWSLLQIEAYVVALGGPS